jgi:hypothetical protein
VGAALIGIYRKRNLSHAQRLTAPALKAGWTVAWWALDETHRALAPVTVGEGPGEKLPLLNRILDRIQPADWTVVSDDDLDFRRGNVIEFVQMCQQLQFDLAQPARDRRTQVTHPITRRARLSRARLTSFVESGPLWAVSPGWRDRVLPLPEHRGMGWGVEIDWHDRYREGMRLGILDALPIAHVGPPAAEYDWREMNRAMKAELAARGNPRWEGMVETLGTWRPWQKHPPWVG